jgi:hypothetical protein
LNISHEQFVRELEATERQIRLIRVHRFEGSESSFFFGKIKYLTEDFLICQSHGNGEQKAIDLQNLAISSNLPDYFPYAAWRLHDRDRNYWDLIDIAMSEDEKQSKLKARLAKMALFRV